MTDDETAEMMRLYEDIVRVDEFRVIRNIGSYERDISPQVREMIHRLSAERMARGKVRRAIDFVSRRDFTLQQKLAHRKRIRRDVELDAGISGFEDSCIIGWYSMVVRSTGDAAPCCILQGKRTGNLFRESLHDVWHGDAYTAFRRELTAVVRGGAAWAPAGDESVVEAVCGKIGTELCSMKSFYYLRDVPFVRELDTLFANIRSSS
jgi:MoaA/NifB/PqqE/SkfB family radical SAM enzyme